MKKKASTLQKSKEDEKPQSKTTTQDSHPNNKDDVKPQQGIKNEGVKAYVPKLPYPTSIHKGTKDQQFPRFLEIFKKHEINIPLAEALEQMPLYAKFLKELITKIRSWQEKETVILTQDCSAIIQRGLPPKLKDPGSFLIPCTIGNIAIDKSLCDLGASINLMPLTMLKKMMIEELKPIRMQYLIGSKILVYTDHAVLKYLMSKQDAKPRLIRWMLLLQEFDIEIKDRKGSENQVADYLSRLPQETSQDTSQPVNENFPNEYLLQIQQTPWFADMANYKAGRSIPQEYTKQQVKKLLHEAKLFFWDEPFLFKRCPDGMIRRCVPEVEMKDILWHYHNSSYGGHFGAERTVAKVLQSCFYWPSIFKDARDFLVYGKACHLPVELEHKAFWATKLLNLDAQAAEEKRLLQLNELEEFRLEAYENARIYKKRAKRWHDKRISPRTFEPGQKVLLFNSRLKIFPGKLRSRWTGPYTITKVSPHGYVELLNETSKETFTVNGHRVKRYLGGPWSKEESVQLLA
ncbi:uncharacterized protein [Arachis hypogaea]|uniref:uncharacterized protein n=1 Tax=Arachis hypogaea TaxID=3818 RepID=UPI003B216CD4